MGKVYEVDKTSGGTVTRTVTYYPAGGAMRINSTLYYILKDHLGSASVVTDANGVTVGETRYYPYGETRVTTGTIYTDKLFTGQRDTGLGIYDYNARFYSPKLGRFLSADTIIQDMGNPQTYNRYSYTLNNPLRYTDPTGHMAVADTGGGGGCVILTCGTTSGGSAGSTGGRTTTTTRSSGTTTSTTNTTESSTLTTNNVETTLDQLLDPSSDGGIIFDGSTQKLLGSQR